METAKRLVLWVSAAAVLVTLVYQAGDILGRYVFNAPLRGVIEIIGSAMVLVVFLPAFINVRESSEIRVEIILDRTPAKFRAVVRALSAGLGLVMLSLLVWRAAVSLITAIQQHDNLIGSISVPTWPSRVLLLLGALLLCAAYVEVLVRLFRGRAQKT